MLVKFSVDIDDHSEKYDYTTDGHYDTESYHDCEMIIEQIAEVYHNDYDGWESRWPIEFKLYDSDDKNLGTFRVERESQPVFSATYLCEQMASD